MNYVESFEMGGVKATQIPCINGGGAPTAETEGAVGCLYMDTDTGDTYKCTSIEDGAYTWVAQDLVKNDIIEYHKQIIFQGDKTFYYKDIFVENPEIGTPYSILVGSIENAPAKCVRATFMAENGKEIRRMDMYLTENVKLTVIPFDGVAKIKFTCYATWSGGLSDTAATYNEVYVVKGTDVVYEIPNVTASKLNKSAVVSLIPSSTIKTIAHRGLCNRAVTQGTRSAYIESRKMGYICAENDLQTTSDGVYITNHELNMMMASLNTNAVRDVTGKQLYVDADDNWYWVDTALSVVYTYDDVTEQYAESSVALDTLTAKRGENIIIANTPYSKLKRILLGNSNDTIMTFAEWILLMKKLGMEAYIDCKQQFTADQIEELVDVVRSLGMINHVTWIISTFDEADALRVNHNSARFGFVRSLSTAEMQQLGEYADAGEVIYYAPAYDITEEVADNVRSYGLTLETWLVASATYCTTEAEKNAEIERLISLGVEGIALDYCRMEDFYLTI